MPRLGFTGDVMLGRLVNDRQRHRSPTAVWDDVLGRLRSLDGLFVNLECCLSTRGSKWTRTRRPFHFRANPDWAVPALEAAGVDWANLANNHLLDFGEAALADTLDHLSDAGIAHSGAGRTRDEAREPATVSLPDLDVALVSFTDNTPEFAAGPRGQRDSASRCPGLTAAESDAAGTAYVEIDADSEQTRRVVRAALDRARESDPDLLVASLHWGPNMVEEPPAEFRAFGRWLVEEGVDLVHGHSAHVFQGVEVHRGAPILYDAGDFVDDYAVDDDLRNDRSFLFRLTVDPAGDPTELRLFPTEIDECAVREADAEAAAWSRERMRALSEPFGTEFEREGEGLVLPL